MKDYDYDGNLRPVLADFDGETLPKPEDAYVVEVWVYRYGFGTMEYFATESEAINYAMNKSRKHMHKRRYRVMGPVEQEEES